MRRRPIKLSEIPIQDLLLGYLKKTYGVNYNLRHLCDLSGIPYERLRGQLFRGSKMPVEDWFRLVIVLGKETFIEDGYRYVLQETKKHQGKLLKAKKKHRKTKAKNVKKYRVGLK